MHIHVREFTSLLWSTFCQKRRWKLQPVSKTRIRIRNPFSVIEHQIPHIESSNCLKVRELYQALQKKCQFSNQYFKHVPEFVILLM